MSDRMDILATRSYTTRDGEVKTAFTRIGTAWATRNGGWQLVFDALPLAAMNDKGAVETRALMMPPKEQAGGRADTDSPF